MLEKIVKEGLPCSCCKEDCKLQCNEMDDTITRNEKKARGIRNLSFTISDEDRNYANQLRYSEQGKALEHFENTRMPGKY